MKKYTLLILIFALFSCTQVRKPQEKPSKSEEKPILIAQTPPMGWNSFDSYGVYLYEEAALANLESFNQKLKPHGYEYFVIDAGWFGEFKLREGTIYPREKHAKKLNFNEYGLLQPSKVYWPNGFEALISKCREMDIKFGLHLMRGIPREAVRLDLPVEGTPYRASQIVDTTSICLWNDQNYGVDMDKPGAQEFYNSLINQMAGWGVDFIKYDDIVPFPREVEAVTKAIAQCGRPIVLSLSPGNKVDENAIDFFKKANMLRVTADIWDDGEGIDKCFNAWKKWTGKEEPGFWIDMDMIPFGQLQMMSPKPGSLPGEVPANSSMSDQKATKLTNIELLSGKGWQRESKFSKDQKYTFITLRALSASPLMMGGDLPTLDDFSLSLLTNKDMIECNQNGVMGSLVYDQDKIEIWKTPKKNSEDVWIGIFNRSLENRSLKLTSDILGLKGEYKGMDIWEQATFEFNKESYQIPAGGVIFLSLKKVG